MHGRLSSLNPSLLSSSFALVGLFLAALSPAQSSPAATPAGPVNGSDDAPIAVAALLGPDLDIPRGGDRNGLLTGRVSVDRSPLTAVRVYAYQLTDLTLSKATTNRAGHFAFANLPAGLYKVIAHKVGFVPAVVMVTRTTANAYQYLDLELAQDADSQAQEAADFWTIRSRIPTDVLHEIVMAESQELAPEGPPVNNDFSAVMSALTGIEDLAQLGEAHLTGGAVDLQGQMGSLQFGMNGDFQRLQGNAGLTTFGEANRVSFDIEAESAKVNVSGRQSSFVGADRGAESMMPSDLEHYGVAWRQQIGGGESTFRAGYVQESNFYQDAGLTPAGVPEASTTWTVEGAYERQITSRNSLRSGLTYRQMEASYALDPTAAIPRERVDLFSLGDWALRDTLVVQYGMFTTLSDGTLSFSPQAGVVVGLGQDWQVEGSVRHRFDQDVAEFVPQFMPTYFDNSNDCGTAEQFCYKAKLTRLLADGGEWSVGALHREYSETLRVFFSESFFDRFDSLFFVPGDRLPELQFALQRNLGSHVEARFESNIGSGGGGQFVTSDGGRFENQIGYLVTSIDTQIKPTSTGVLVAFHRMEQNLQSQDSSDRGLAAPKVDLDRLQILLRQDLQRLLGWASDWAVTLDMQLSRGVLPYTASTDDVHKRVVGGLAVRF